MNISFIKTLLLALIATSFAASLIAFPQESLQASERGLQMWWGVVFPSLLPFFIVSELLIAFGVVKFLGVLLEPLMRPIFRVPGSGGFVWAMGMASGFPAGAKLTARLRQEEQLSQVEAERLVSFTNSSNPLFIFGAVSAGFFENVHIGVILVLAHFLGNILVGVMMRFYGVEEKRHTRSIKQPFLVRNAFRELHHSRLRDNRPLGKLLGDAVMSSIQTLLMIGGFIILFSVLNSILKHISVTNILAIPISYLFSIFQLPNELSIPFISGLFEITLGSQLTSKVSTSLLYQVMIVSFLLGFSGFSVHAQVASILAQTDIRFKPFFFARIIQGASAAFFAWVLWKPLYIKLYSIEHTDVTPVFQFNDSNPVVGYFHQLFYLGPTITISFLLLYILLYYSRHFLNKRNDY
ncbi:sporulation integral membrane protein YlbJ [Bacillus spongiae]|uniref:Sporulation integral membrane protein YlbJ n=1 Tax=Bacillus spongiae TaxID=2683610 RepID=A0ABU8HA09_9BACI